MNKLKNMTVTIPTIQISRAGSYTDISRCSTPKPDEENIVADALGRAFKNVLSFSGSVP